MGADYKEREEQMKRISSYAGNRPDYVQGGGGNTSVKFDDELMAIKASGYTLAEITERKGYVTVDYKKIMGYYNTVDAGAEKDFEKESLDVNLRSIVLLPGMEEKRPSVEVGFHSFLSVNVIHTHAVYANILCCTEEGRGIAEEIFRGSGIGYVFLPYIDPGFRLTLAVKQAVDQYRAEHGVLPDAVFMDNHGIIVHNDNPARAMEIHEEVNNRIRKKFDLHDFPQPSIKKTADGFISTTDYMKNFILETGADESYFNALTLYPDQLVYLGGKIGNIIVINKETGETVYHAAEKEAQTLEETLLGVVYVIRSIQKSGLTLRQMDEAGADFINNWESEKYRQKLIK
jgi:ribulose-5-phosphate 4-epimerase/fuculose-1-phosphate aldolase